MYCPRTALGLNANSDGQSQKIAKYKHVSLSLFRHILANAKVILKSTLTYFTKPGV